MNQILCQFGLQFFDAGGDAELAALRDAQSGMAARVDAFGAGFGFIPWGDMSQV